MTPNINLWHSTSIWKAYIRWNLLVVLAKFESASSGENKYQKVNGLC
jgi:hypothetical protein